MKLNVKIRKVDIGKIKGFADVTLGGMFVIKDLKVFEGTNGLFVTMPNVKLGKPYKDKQGKMVEYQDTFYPVTKEAREQLLEAVLSAYNGTSSAGVDDEFPF